MKAAVYHGIQDVRFEEVPAPACGPAEILVGVNYCAVCGTDVRIYLHGHKNVTPPAVTGHEITGRVLEIGPEVKEPGLAVGDRVTLVTSIGCGRCKMCRRGLHNLCPDTKAIGYRYPGGFAERLAVPAEAVRQRAVLKLPDNLSLLEGALIEPLSCAINGQNYLQVRPDDTVVIYGGGPIGFMHAALALAVPAARVIMIDPAFDRLKHFGREFPGLILWDPKEVRVADEVNKLTGGFGADVVITACPSPQAQVEGLGLLGSRGRISLFGGLPKEAGRIEIDANLVHYKELSVYGAFASNRADYLEAARLLSERKIEAEKFISSVRPLSEFPVAVELIRSGAVLKVVLEVKKDGDANA
ncbi:MAG TPA: alcohol dehydrogenase catalytic domain-containing protein [bacterium]|nr:alcohol dehydrogenase catalytic domain-containing protein [bacterium]